MYIILQCFPWCLRSPSWSKLCCTSCPLQRSLLPYLYIIIKTHMHSNPNILNSIYLHRLRFASRKPRVPWDTIGHLSSCVAPSIWLLFQLTANRRSWKNGLCCWLQCLLWDCFDQSCATCDLGTTFQFPWKQQLRSCHASWAPFA